MNCLGLRQRNKAHRLFQASIALAALLAARSVAAQTFTTLHDFSPAAGHPQAPVIESVSGDLWGTTFDGGLYGKGSIFILTPDGSGGFTFAEPHSFTGGADGTNPGTALLQGTDGFMYGVISGGTSGLGLVYRIDSSGSNLEVIHEFTSTEGSGPSGALIQGSDGLLYGTTVTGGASGFGTVFALNPTGGSLVVIHNFSNSDGAYSRSSLLEASDGRLYGTTSGGGDAFTGVVFKLDKSGANFAVLHSFSGTDGSSPQSGLIQLLDGLLYGTASGGGLNFYGAVFKLDTAGNNFAVIHDFTGTDGQNAGSSLVLAPDGLLYGTTPNINNDDAGSVFRLNSSGTTFDVVHVFADAEGISPAAALLKTTGGSLYGTTQYGSAGGNGAVFRLDPSTGDVTVAHFFVSPDTFNPVSALVLGPGGFLFGTGRGGGVGYGALFKTNASGASYSLLHSFTVSDGGYSNGPLIVGADGFIYGTGSGLAGFGGVGYGTVFRVDGNGANFSVIHDFALTDGNDPLGGVIQGDDGFLYGCTVNGGTYGQGVVYRLNTSGQNFSVLHEFADAGPQAALLRALDGLLYGTTYSGGAHGYGSIFRLDTAGNNFEVIHSFTNSDGAFPAAGLIQRADGKLYGTASSGTQKGNGGVYRLDPTGANFAVIHKFTGPDGASPYAPVFGAADGFLYGTTLGGGANTMGTVFRLKPGGGSFALSHSFGGADGATPFGGIIQGIDGGLYGTAKNGGALNGGVAFRLDRVTYALVVFKSGTGTGKVVSAPAGVNCGGTCSAAFAVGTAVTLTPTPSANSLFGGWTGDPDCADGNVTMTSDKACTAVFNLGPDLVVSALSAPASAEQGMAITVSDTTKNRGAGAVGTSKTKYYLSVDATVGPGDVLLGSRNVPALAAGASSNGSVIVTIRENQAPGSYFVIAFADANGAKTETDETNNTRARAITIRED